VRREEGLRAIGLSRVGTFAEAAGAKARVSDRRRPDRQTKFAVKIGALS